METTPNTAPTSETQSGTAPIQSETLTTPGTGETPGNGTTTAQSPADTQKEIERLNSALKRANAEAKEHRLAKEELDKIKAAQMTEQERLQKQYDDLKTQHDEAIQVQTERAIKSEVAVEAAKLGVDPAYLDKVARFLDWEEIEVDDNGNPTNIQELVAQLVKEMPGLKPLSARTAPTGGGATAPARSQTSGNGEITAEYVADVMAGRIDWKSLTQERRSAILNWKAKNAFRF
jgi:hypothetical protein